MTIKISGTSRMLLLSIAFCMVLLMVRFVYTGDTITYRCYAWNTFLATIPYVMSNLLLKKRKLKKFSALLILSTWLLFLPNAPYLITDVFHFEQRADAPLWYDLLLVISGAWNGVMLGMGSLMNIERFLSRHLKPFLVKASVFVSLLLCGYGVFIGRYLRFNSWDIVTDPRDLMYASAHHILLPLNYPKLWVFTALFAGFLMIIYFTLKELPGKKINN